MCLAVTGGGSIQMVSAVNQTSPAGFWEHYNTVILACFNCRVTLRYVLSRFADEQLNGDNQSVCYSVYMEGSGEFTQAAGPVPSVSAHSTPTHSSSSPERCL